MSFEPVVVKARRIFSTLLEKRQNGLEQTISSNLDFEGIAKRLKKKGDTCY